MIVVGFLIGLALGLLYSLLNMKRAVDTTIDKILEVLHEKGIIKC